MIRLLLNSSAVFDSSKSFENLLVFSPSSFLVLLSLLLFSFFFLPPRCFFGLCVNMMNLRPYHHLSPECHGQICSMCRAECRMHHQTETNTQNTPLHPLLGGSINLHPNCVSHISTEKHRISHISLGVVFFVFVFFFFDALFDDSCTFFVQFKVPLAVGSMTVLLVLEPCWCFFKLLLKEK